MACIRTVTLGLRMGAISKFIFAFGPEMSYTSPGIGDVLSSSPVDNDTQVKEHARQIWNFVRLKVEDEAVRNLL
jgi:hypothetical protein